MKFPSDGHWNSHYSNGGMSGLGSIGVMREWKWTIIKNKAGDIDDVVDVGCGDLSFWGQSDDCKKYTGIDSSKFIIGRHIHLAETFKYRANWQFICSPAETYIDGVQGRIVLCLDVLFHILDENVFSKILDNLSLYSTEWVFINSWIKSPWEGKITDGLFQKFWSPDKYALSGFKLTDFYVYSDAINCMFCFKKEEA